MTMIKNRIGTDITISWPITIDGEERPLSEYNLTLYISCNRFKKKMDFTTENNTITFTFYGKDQKVRGDYDLLLVLNEGLTGQVMLDNKKAFNLYE